MATQPQRDDGFTLVELLVVIIIIGVLAAIAIPVYLEQRKKGYRAAATADMKNAATAVETYATDHQGVFSDLDGADQDSPLLDAEGYNRSVWIRMKIVATATEYCLRGEHEDFPEKEFVFRSGRGVVEIDAPGVIPCE